MAAASFATFWAGGAESPQLYAGTSAVMGQAFTIVQVPRRPAAGTWRARSR